MSNPTPPANSFMNSALVTTISGYVARLQEQNVFSKPRLNSLKQHFLITIGFLVLLYCLIHIQILFFGLLKLIFQLLSTIISMLFWLPLNAVRFFVPKTIDYDIIFPVFWLCSIVSFYISKYFHENICQFYDQYLVRRYKILNNDQIKREDIKRYLFITTFITLLLLQSLFILIPIALSVRHQPVNTKVSPTPVVVTQKTTVKTPTTKSAVTDVVETMGGNLYKRFIDAFTDENEIPTNEKRAPLVSDEKLEDTFKTIQKTIKHEVDKMKTANKQEEKKSSRFHRWIIHYLKAPFQIWEGKKNEEVKSTIEQKNLEDEHDDEEENDELDSSSLISDTDESDDEDDDSSETDEDDEDSDEEEESSAKPIETIKKLSSSTDSDDEDSDSEEESDEEPTVITNKIKEQLAKPIERMKDIAKTVGSKIRDKISSSTDKDEEESGYESDDEREEEESSRLTEKIKETIAKPIEKAKNVVADIKNRIDSSSDEEAEDEEPTSITEKIKERFAKSIEAAKHLGEKVLTNVKDKLSPSASTDEEDGEVETDEEEHPSILDRVKQNVLNPVETAATNLRDKLPSLAKNEEEDLSLIDRTKQKAEEIITPIKDKISSNVDELKHKATHLADNTEKFATNILGKSSKFLHEKTEQIKDKLPKTDKVLSNIKHRVVKPLESKASKLKKAVNTETKHISSNVDELKHKATHLADNTEKFAANILGKSSKLLHEKTEQIKDKLPKTDGVLSNIKHRVVEPLESKASKLKTAINTETKHISSNVDELKHKATHLGDNTEKVAANILEKSSEFLHEKTEQIKDKLPKTGEVLSNIKHRVVKPLESKASKLEKAINTETKDVKETVVKKLKSLKKKKKPKSLTEKAKDKFKSLSKSIQEKLPGRRKKKKNTKLKFRQKISGWYDEKLNGWYDEAWNIWHLTKNKLSHIFILSTKHARHLPRYNTTSLYTAYTDLNCYDYTKQMKRYRKSNLKQLYFLDTYRPHSPFPVYLSVLKSNGPKCYRHYPDSSCGIQLKSTSRSFISQFFRFVRFWAIIGIIVVILAVIYKNLTHRKQNNTSSYHHGHEDSDRSSNKKQQTTVSNQNDVSTSVTTQKPSSINQQTISTNPNSRPLNDQIEKQVRLWLQHEQNDGFRNLSETCRIAINNTFLKQLERLSVETLQFAHAKIRNVSQNNNPNKTDDTPAEKIVINAVLDIDHLILNIVNTFKEQHFSLETPKLSGQLYVLLIINPNQYSIEANLKQLQINPVNIIDPNHALSVDERHSIVKVLDETINRTVVRCSFRLSDNQENTNHNTLYNSSPTTYPDTNKNYSTSNQLSASSVQTAASRSRQPTPNRYQPSEPLPTVVINDTDQRLYTNDSLLDNEPKRVLIRIVKAVKLHDVEQPYCILELNHPKQIQQTSIAKNGLNPFWDERFLFECDEQSNQIHLQIIDHKKTNKRTGNPYVDTVYADVSIPFSYATSTVYKQDVQISPQYPESIIRIEFSTLSEEEALAANNGYDIESLTDSQTWTYNEREANKIEHDYPQRYQHSPSNDFVTSSYDANTLPKHYGLSTSLYDDERDFASTLPRSTDHRSATNPYSTSSPLVPRNGIGNDKPQKSKSFMSSLKHLTLPRRKQRSKSKHDTSMSSQASSISQLNTSIQSPQTNPISHSLSSAVPGPKPEYFLESSTDIAPIRRSRSISQSFKNLFRSHSKKKANAAKADALGEFENGKHSFLVENRNYLSTSTPTSKKLSFLQRRKSKQKAKQQTNFSSNSLSSYDCSRLESVRDTPIRANVGYPVTMTKTLVQ